MLRSADAVHYGKTRCLRQGRLRQLVPKLSDLDKHSARLAWRLGWGAGGMEYVARRWVASGYRHRWASRTPEPSYGHAVVEVGTKLDSSLGTLAASDNRGVRQCLVMADHKRHTIESAVLGLFRRAYGLARMPEFVQKPG